MLGRAATRIELNRDSDMDELEMERQNRLALHQQRQMLSPHHQQPFGASNMRHGHMSQQPGDYNSAMMHSIMSRDSDSSGPSGPSLIQMQSFQAQNMSQHLNGVGAGDQSSSLLIFGVGPMGTHSHSPAGDNQRGQAQRGHQTQTDASNQGVPSFYPPQQP